MKKLTYAIFFLIAVIGCKTTDHKHDKTLDDIADKYLKLALEIGQYDPDIIDAYYGPEKWKPTSNEGKTLPYE